MDIETRNRLNREWTEEQDLCSDYPMSNVAWQPDNPENRRIKKSDNTGYVNSYIADTIKQILKEHTLPEEKNMMHYDLAKIKKVYSEDNFKDKYKPFNRLSKPFFSSKPMHRWTHKSICITTLFCLVRLPLLFLDVVNKLSTRFIIFFLFPKFDPIPK